MGIEAILTICGIPTAITGLLVWLLKKHIDKVEHKREEKEHNKEQLMLIILQKIRATNVLTEATARAVQRIPDAHCNGDMTSALDKVAEIKAEEQKFLMSQGVEHIFGE